MHRVLISLPEALLRDVDRVAREQGLTRSEFFRRALSEAVTRHDQAALRDLCAEGYRALAAEDLAEAESYTGVRS